MSLYFEELEDDEELLELELEESESDEEEEEEDLEQW